MVTKEQLKDAKRLIREYEREKAKRRKGRS